MLARSAACRFHFFPNMVDFSRKLLVRSAAMCSCDVSSTGGPMILAQGRRLHAPSLLRRSQMHDPPYSALFVIGALEGVGLDPAVGFLHTDRPGRPSLALDLMEEMRPWLADRFVLALINLRQLSATDFMKDEARGVTLTDEGRRRFLTAYQKR